MKNPFILVVTIVFAMLFQSPLMAQKQHEKHNENSQKEAKITKVHPNGKTKVVKTHSPKVSYPHNQFPRTKVIVLKPRVRTINVLGANHSRIVYRNKPYYYQGGRYYSYVNNSYTIIAPPHGIRIGFLPIGYRRIMVGNVSNYYYMGAYYRPIGSEYEAFEPNVGTIVPDLPEDNVEEVTIDGQLYYECNDILYKSINTANGTEYEVVGKIND